MLKACFQLNPVEFHINDEFSYVGKIGSKFLSIENLFLLWIKTVAIKVNQHVAKVTKIDLFVWVEL